MVKLPLERKKIVFETSKFAAYKSQELYPSFGFEQGQFYHHVINIRYCESGLRLMDAFSVQHG